MIVFSVPSKLRLAAASVFLAIPLICLQVIIMTRAPWWNLPLLRLAYWSFAFFMISAPLYFWILSAKRWSYYLALTLGVMWVLMSSWFALRMQYPALGFFSLLLTGAVFLQFMWIRNEVQRSFFDPRLTWYQGLPQPIPLLKCRLGSLDFRVSRIDEEGIFVFYPQSFSSEEELESKFNFLFDKKDRKKIEILFQFRDHTFSCYGKPILTIHRNLGLGIQFIEMSHDQRKELGDFIEVLRGEGYVE